MGYLWILFEVFEQGFYFLEMSSYFVLHMCMCESQCAECQGYIMLSYKGSARGKWFF